MYSVHRMTGWGGRERERPKGRDTEAWNLGLNATLTLLVCECGWVGMCICLAQLARNCLTLRKSSLRT